MAFLMGLSGFLFVAGIFCVIAGRILRNANKEDTDAAMLIGFGAIFIAAAISLASGVRIAMAFS